MICHLRLLALVLLILSPAAWAGRPERAEKQVARGMELLERGDLWRAQKKFQKATELDPHNSRAWMQYGMVSLLIAAEVEGTGLEGVFQSVALSSFERVVELDPDGLDAPYARQGIADLVGSTALLTLPEVVCSDASVAAFEQAESALFGGDPTGAKAHYQAALDGCPDNATWWVYYGDALFQQGDLDGALERYEHALGLDRCHWQAHRFASDAWYQLGERDKSLTHAATAVACNPQYEIGWQWLVRVATHDAHRGIQGVDLTGAALGLSPDDRSLGRRRAVIRAAIDEGAGVTPDAAALIGEIDAEGWLDEALLVWGFDEDVLDAYLAHRDAHLDRLVAFVLRWGTRPIED